MNVIEIDDLENISIEKDGKIIEYLRGDRDRLRYRRDGL
jgi:hypothetical protein